MSSGGIGDYSAVQLVLQVLPGYLDKYVIRGEG